MRKIFEKLEDILSKLKNVSILKFYEENSDCDGGLFIYQTEYKYEVISIEIPCSWNMNPSKLRFGEIKILPTYINVHNYKLKNLVQKLKFCNKVNKRACQQLMVSPEVNIGDLKFKSPYNIEFEDKYVVIYLTTNHPFITTYLVINNLDDFISTINKSKIYELY